MRQLQSLQLVLKFEFNVFLVFFYFFQKCYVNDPKGDEPLFSFRSAHLCFMNTFRFSKSNNDDEFGWESIGDMSVSTETGHHYFNGSKTVDGIIRWVILEKNLNAHATGCVSRRLHLRTGYCSPRHARLFTLQARIRACSVNRQFASGTNSCLQCSEG